jgi:DNA-binding CsgD family transcriptional regulator/PAS domain-containing protein
MVTVSAYDSVIHEIYEAALVPARWESALTCMITTFAPREWEVAFLLWERHDPPGGRFLGSAGVNPMAHDVYLSSFAGNNEWSQHSRRMKVGEAVHTDQLLRRERFAQSTLYRDFLQHWGYGVAIIAMLDRHGPDQLGLVMPGPITSDPGDLLVAVTLLVPHFHRAARISRRIAEADMRAATATSLLDTSPYAVFALGPDMTMLLANGSGQALLDQGSVLALRNGRVTVPDPADQAELTAMSRGLGRNRTYSHDAQNRAHLLTALSVTPQLGGQFENRASGASLMLIGGQRVGLSGELTMQIEQTFGLTPAEARLAGHMLEGAGLEGYMQDRSVSIHAARFLLKGIYAKTGARNQAELSALLREAPLGWNAAAIG